MDWNLIVAVAATVVSVCTLVASLLIKRRVQITGENVQQKVAVSAAVKFASELTAVYRKFEDSKAVVIVNPSFATFVEPDGKAMDDLAVFAVERNFDLIGAGNTIVVDEAAERAKAISWSRELAAA